MFSSNFVPSRIVLKETLNLYPPLPSPVGRCRTPSAYVEHPIVLQGEWLLLL